MKICPKCSNECKDGATVCPRCGNKLIEPTPIRRSNPPVPPPPPEPPKSKLSRREHLSLGLVIGGVAGALVALVAILLVNRPAVGPVVTGANTGGGIVTDVGATVPPAEEVAPAAEENAATAQDQAPVGAPVGDEAEAPAQDETPLEGEMPVGAEPPEAEPTDEVALPEVALPVEDQAPDEAALPVEDQAPDEVAPPVDEPTEAGPADAVDEAVDAGNAREWDLAMDAPEHLWLKVQTTATEAVPPVITLYHMNGEDTVYAIVNQITPIRAESPQGDGQGPVTWLWDVAPKWGDLKGAFGAQPTPLNMVAVYSEGNVADQPYEVLWDCMNDDELTLRTKLSAEGYVFPADAPEAEG